MAPAGHVLLSADYAQMELRLMAHLSGDERLIATLCDPAQDPFAHWAAQWLRIHPHSVCAQALPLLSTFTSHCQALWAPLQVS